jgi:hypothetical protein
MPITEAQGSILGGGACCANFFDVLDSLGKEHDASASSLEDAFPEHKRLSVQNNNCLSSLDKPVLPFKPLDMQAR